MNDLSNTRNHSKSWWVALGRHAMIERKEIILNVAVRLKNIYIYQLRVCSENIHVHTYVNIFQKQKLHQNNDEVGIKTIIGR